MLSVKQDIFSLKMSISSESFDAACLHDFSSSLIITFDETSKYRKKVEFQAQIVIA